MYPLTRKIAIIGAGPGGYVAAIRAAQLGADVYLIENDKIGGTCLNRGCIPTKTYFKNAQVMNSLKRANEFAIEVDGYRLDGKKLLDRKNQVVNTLVSGIEKLISSYKNIETILGTASLKDKNTLSVELVSGEIRDIEVDNIIIATGSKAQMTETRGLDLDGVITSDQLLELEEIPQTLIVVGGGVIGLEFASIYQELGSQVILLASRILKDADKEVSRRLTPLLKKQGIEVYTDIRASEIISEGNRLKVTARYKTKDEEVVVLGDKVLIASGRSPLVDGLNLDNVGIAYDRKGIEVDEHFETSVKGIFAIGDVNNTGIQLAHVASSQGTYVVEKLMGLNPDIDLQNFPACVFTMTEVAQVGYTEEELKDKEIDYKVSKFTMGASGKALSQGDTDGFVKVLASNEGKILGVHILSAHANDMIAEGTLALANDLDVNAIAKAIHAHPTLSESFHEAVLGLDEKAIHLAPKKKRETRS